MIKQKGDKPMACKGKGKGGKGGGKGGKGK